MTFKRILTFFCIAAVLEAGTMVSLAIWLHKDDLSAYAYEFRHPEGGAMAEPPVEERPKDDRAADTATIEQDVKGMLGSEAQYYAIYFLRPQREIEPYIYNSHAMSPASMIKVFVMAATMEEVHAGRLSLDDELLITDENVVEGAGRITWYDIGKKMSVRRLLTLMITVSDNTATNTLIDHLGMDGVNEYARTHGYNDTVLAHKMMIGNRGMRNLSSPRDIGRLFARLYYGQLVGEQEDAFMRKILLGQTDKECFGAALPDWDIAHKTGEVTGLYDDGGIFYGQRGDFVLVIMNEKRYGRQENIDMMKKLTRYFAQTL